MIHKKHNKGVSPIVGVILMVVLAILLAGVISQFGQELSGILTQPITAGINIQESYNVQDDTYDVTIVWSSSGTVEEIYAIEPDGSRTPAMQEVGDDIQIENVEGDESIRIMGTLSTGEQGVIQEYTAG